ncbi:Hint domain-containing protein [Sulfitobacter sabulilitoris]|uniref:Hint domain-containing protein n=1 Tax=Sulfitobacter sabulilitoris TaxID=2562655 RepID=A0A5S3PLM1_9RHOB|nr:Hint domain-containing protein [Sulfitobacter sabulilitoris]TMM54470.1 Hint domain-containing protein [Sulfitobacter sabulilitoris]
MPSVGLIFLGNFAEADTDESNWSNENDNVFDGRHDNRTIKALTADVTEPQNDGVAYDDDQGSAASEITYDLGDGAGSRTITQDSVAVYLVTIERGDGTTFDTRVNIIQLVNGDTFVTENSNGASLDNIAIQSITVGTLVEDNASGWFTANSADGASVVCFVAGTRIRTPRGDIPVEHLAPGDLVLTADHGAQPIVWCAAQTLCPDASTRPITIEAGALGPNRPSAPLLVSPQHRIVLRSRIIRRLYGDRDVLVAAKALLGIAGCHSLSAPGHATEGCATVRYHHILLARHEIVIANGAFAETFLPGPTALAALEGAARISLRAHLDATGRRAEDYRPCRPVVRGHACDDLLSRHLRHARPLFARTGPGGQSDARSIA